MDTERKGDAVDSHIEVASGPTEMTPSSRFSALSDAKHRLLDNARLIRKDSRIFLWCIFVQLFLVNFGFDAKMTGLIIAFPEFRKAYGHYHEPSQSYIVSAFWQSMWAAGNTIGMVTGSLFCSVFLDRVGRKTIMYATIVLSIVTTVMLVIAPNLKVLFAIKVIFGVATGFSLTVAPLYIAENAPTSIRGSLTSMVNLFIVFGQFLAAAVANATQNFDGAWSYKASFALTALFPVLLLLGIWWLPESPAWLVARRRHEHAQKSLRRLYGSNTSDDKILEIIAEMEHLVRHATNEEPTLRDCFRKGHVRQRTLISIVVLSMQPLCGMLFILPYQTYFYQLSGLTRSFSIALGSTAAMLVACIISTIFSDTFGRRNALLLGISFMLVWNAIIGFVSIAPKSNRDAAFTAVGFVASWPMLYQLSLGCLGWAVACEIQTQRLRAKTLGIANVAAQTCSWAISFTIPYLFNPDQANLGGKIMFIYLALSLPFFLWLSLKLPETRGRSFEELDKLYEMGVNPRKFKDATAIGLRELEKPVDGK